MHTEKKTDSRKKLEELDVLDIIRLNTEGVSLKILASRYNVSYEQVRRIVSGLVWKRLHDRIKHQHLLDSIEKSK